ncbi:PREDICTED: cytochrome b-c1 complex subunit 9 [Eufriesea mexicana]|uniref:cytochrome b-c1 complex subunit 9 n=1 Tax=Eufriesea mexicana TaxID=516756 RepID=UPI00083BA8AA|nr:PREDICTED: cytochrome b-c1 complex subunit 9 [Eufriesea mexicana]
MSNFLYNLIFKKSSTFTVVILTGAFFFERALDMASDKIFYAVNKGRLWKDIEPQYLQK